jgi:hypothetical protein
MFYISVIKINYILSIMATNKINAIINFDALVFNPLLRVAVDELVILALLGVANNELVILPLLGVDNNELVILPVLGVAVDELVILPLQLSVLQQDVFPP